MSREVSADNVVFGVALRANSPVTTRFGNVNKIALLRNSRDIGIPSVLWAVETAFARVYMALLSIGGQTVGTSDLRMCMQIRKGSQIGADCIELYTA
jgi:hypothetical protein